MKRKRCRSNLWASAIFSLGVFKLQLQHLDNEEQEDCKVAFFTAKDAKSAKEMLAMDIS